MTIHICKYCDYSTTKKASYDEHMTRPKHKNNVLKQKPEFLHGYKFESISSQNIQKILKP